MNKLKYKVYGYRVWKFNRDLHLRSIAVDYTWEKGEQEHSKDAVGEQGPTLRYGTGTTSFIGQGDRKTPSEGTEYGYYAFHDLDETIGRMSQITNPMWGTTELALIGLMAGWGEMCVHSEGFRSEYAEPIALLGGPYGDKLTDVLTAAVGKEYGIPVIHDPEYVHTWASEQGYMRVPSTMYPRQSEEEDLTIGVSKAYFMKNVFLAPIKQQLAAPPPIFLNPYKKKSIGVEILGAELLLDELGIKYRGMDFQQRVHNFKTTRYIPPATTITLTDEALKRVQKELGL